MMTPANYMTNNQTIETCFIFFKRNFLNLLNVDYRFICLIQFLQPKTCMWAIHSLNLRVFVLVRHNLFQAKIPVLLSA